MSNYFEYQDFARVDKSEMDLSTTQDALQSPSDINDLKNGVEPYDYASFEEGKYITANPKTLIKSGDKVGFLTKATQGSIELVVYFGDSYTIPGITLGFVNIPDMVNITYFGDTTLAIRSETYTREDITDNLHFFNMSSEGVKKVVVGLQMTTKNQFIGLYRMDFGSVRIFDDSNLINASVESFFDNSGETLEYDIMNATVFLEENENFLFIKKQPIVYKSETGENLNKFFAETGDKTSDNILKIKAYDAVSNLEDNFMGGIYGFPNIYTNESRPPYPYNQLIADVLEDTGIEYECVNTENIGVTGYLPIDSKRNTLAMIFRGTNTRCYKRNGKLIFKPIDSTDDVEFGDAEIVENPTIKVNQRCSDLTFVEHKYKKSNEEVELYNWYLQKGEGTNQVIEFPYPVWWLSVYEVTGVDDQTGLDIIEESESTNISFATSPQDEGDEQVCNYAVVDYCRTSNKVVITGRLISESGHNIEVSLKNKDVNADYKSVVVDDVTIVSQPLEVAKTLFAMENYAKKQDFQIVEKEAHVGDNAQTSLVDNPTSIEIIIENQESEVVYNPKVSYVKDDLSGVYKVAIE